MSDKPSILPSFVRRFLYILAFLYIAGTVCGGIALGWIAVHPPGHPVTASEEKNARFAAANSGVEFRDAELTTSDGAVLQAWFMGPREPNGDAVILLHGVSDNRMGMYGYGAWLVQHHYAVLIPDSRAQGNTAANWPLMESANLKIYTAGSTGLRLRYIHIAYSEWASRWGRHNCFSHWRRNRVFARS